MSLLRLLHQTVSPRAMADEILRLQLHACVVAREMYPGSPPHVWLAHAWMSRDAARRGPMTMDSPDDAMRRTFGFALLEWPSSARALGHYVIEVEQPMIQKLLPEYAHEAAELAAVIEAHRSSGRAMLHYREMNPGMRAFFVNGLLAFETDEEVDAIDAPAPAAFLPPPAPPPRPALPPPITADSQPVPPPSRTVTPECPKCSWINMLELRVGDPFTHICDHCGAYFAFQVSERSSRW